MKKIFLFKPGKGNWGSSFGGTDVLPSHIYDITPEISPLIQPLQAGDNISLLVNDAGYLTSGDIVPQSFNDTTQIGNTSDREIFVQGARFSSVFQDKLSIGQDAFLAPFGQGIANLHIGSRAGSNTAYGTFIGTDAGNGNTAVYATGLGVSALHNNTSSFGHSTGLGYQAGMNNTGNNGLYVGYLAGKDNVYNNVAIFSSNSAKATADNQFVIGTRSAIRFDTDLNGERLFQFPLTDGRLALVSDIIDGRPNLQQVLDKGSSAVNQGIFLSQTADNSTMTLNPTGVSIYSIGTGLNTQLNLDNLTFARAGTNGVGRNLRLMLDPTPSAGSSAEIVFPLTSGTVALVSDIPSLAPYQLLSEKGQANGYASLNASGKIPNSQIPALAISETFPVNSQAEMLALVAEKGDVAIRQDITKSFILRQEPASVLGNWSELLTPISPVQSVNGLTGTVILGKSEIGLGNVDNTSDLNKPISTATQTALNLKANVNGSNTTGGSWNISNVSSPGLSGLQVFNAGSATEIYWGNSLITNYFEGANANAFKVNVPGLGIANIWNGHNFNPALKANDADVLHKTGVETIQDNKLVASSKSINFFNERYGIGTPDGGLQIYSATFDVIRFGSRAADLTFTEHARFNGATGFFGLATTNPTERLDVAGNIKASGFLMASPQLRMGNDNGYLQLLGLTDNLADRRFTFESNPGVASGKNFNLYAGGQLVQTWLEDKTVIGKPVEINGDVIITDSTKGVIQRDRVDGLLKRLVVSGGVSSWEAV